MSGDAKSKICETVFITGRGRSGTTWLGSILNSHRDCIYKYEPFLGTKSTPYVEWLGRIDDTPIETLRAEYECLCLRSFHNVDMPPFPPKSFRPQPRALLRTLYFLGHYAAPLRIAYERFSRPVIRRPATVLIKDVNFPNETLERFCEVIEPMLIAIVRHPYANIASGMRGYESGAFTIDRAWAEARVTELIGMPGGEPYRDYLEGLSELSQIEFEALTWRIQAEPLVAFAATYPKARTLTYDDLCRDPEKEVGALYAFLGWDDADLTERALAGRLGYVRRGDDYFSTVNARRDTLTKWKTQLSAAQCEDIARILEPSPIKHLWPDWESAG